MLQKHVRGSYRLATISDSAGGSRRDVGVRNSCGPASRPHRRGCSAGDLRWTTDHADVDIAVVSTNRHRRSLRPKRGQEPLGLEPGPVSPLRNEQGASLPTSDRQTGGGKLSKLLVGQRYERSGQQLPSARVSRLDLLHVLTPRPRAAPPLSYLERGAAPGRRPARANRRPQDVARHEERPVSR